MKIQDNLEVQSKGWLHDNWCENEVVIEIDNVVQFVGLSFLVWLMPEAGAPSQALFKMCINDDQPVFRIIYFDQLEHVRIFCMNPASDAKLKIKCYYDKPKSGNDLRNLSFMLSDVKLVHVE